MDTTASEISFDGQGICSFCHAFDARIAPMLARTRTPEGQVRYRAVLEGIRRAGQGHEHDALLGLSGGTDSSYLAYIVANEGLRPLVVHVDMGWNTPLSEANVNALVEHLGLDLEVVRVDREPMRQLQLAFYRAGLKNCEIPQDHVYLAALYEVAQKRRLRTYLSGGNAVAESVLPRSWGYNTADLRHLRDVHRRFGQGSLCGLPTLSFWRRYLYARFLRPVSEVRLLDMLPYSPTEAKRTLVATCGWKDYGAKHYESVLTRFYQGSYLPDRFGIDKRRAHYSSLILAGEMTREAAMAQLAKPPYPDADLLAADRSEIAVRLGIGDQEWRTILAAPRMEHTEFANSAGLFAVKNAVARWRDSIRHT